VARECASESEKREESKPERKGMNVFSLDLKTVIESLSITHFHYIGYFCCFNAIVCF